jgi:hypothetical protein
VPAQERVRTIPFPLFVEFRERAPAGHGFSVRNVKHVHGEKFGIFPLAVLRDKERDPVAALLDLAPLPPPLLETSQHRGIGPLRGHKARIEGTQAVPFTREERWHAASHIGPLFLGQGAYLFT